MGRLRPAFLITNNFLGEVLIESGTSSGLAVERCRHLFKTIHTIELSPRMYEIAKKKLSRYGNVHLHHGDSVEVLPKIIDPTKKTVLFLDAHFVANFTDPSLCKQQCPVIDELNIIFSFTWTTPPTVLIDDARMFRLAFWRTEEASGYDRRQWPNIQRVCRVAGRGGYGVRQVNDVLVLEAIKTGEQ